MYLYCIILYFEIEKKISISITIENLFLLQQTIPEKSCSRVTYIETKKQLDLYAYTLIDMLRIIFNDYNQ